MDNPTCSVEGCERETGVPGSALGLCGKHYQRLKKYGSTDLPERHIAICAVDGCDGKRKAGGYCGMHYARFKAHGTLDGAPPAADLPGERWLPVSGYEGHYEVSDLGRVRNLRRGTVQKTLPDLNGYLTAKLSRSQQVRSYRVHRLVARAFLGPCPEDMEVRHLDGDPSNPALVNLAYGTHSENMKDMQRHGTDRNSTKTHCPKNHEYDDVNTRWYRGSRYCRQCRREYGKPVSSDI